MVNKRDQMINEIAEEMAAKIAAEKAANESQIQSTVELNPDIVKTNESNEGSNDESNTNEQSNNIVVPPSSILKYSDNEQLDNIENDDHIKKIYENIEAYNNKTKKDKIDSIKNLFSKVEQTMMKYMRGVVFLNKLKKSIQDNGDFFIQWIFNNDELDVLEDILKKYESYSKENKEKLVVDTSHLGNWESRGNIKDIVVYLYDKIRLMLILKNEIESNLKKFATIQNISEKNKLMNFILFYFSEVKGIINITRDANNNIVGYKINNTNELKSEPLSQVYLKYIERYIGHLNKGISINRTFFNKLHIGDKTLNKNFLLNILQIKSMVHMIKCNNFDIESDQIDLKYYDKMWHNRSQTRTTQKFTNFARNISNRFQNINPNAPVVGGRTQKRKNKKTRKQRKQRRQRK
jgi:F0F1-type ATP synthase delta subunit